MTRINCVQPSELVDKHLFAEIRELPRLRHLRPRHNVPQSYRMGTGHVLFFMDKGKYLEQRHRSLLAEWHRRNHQCNIPALKLDWPDDFMNDWMPDKVAMNINRERIQERLCK